MIDLHFPNHKLSAVLRIERYPVDEIVLTHSERMPVEDDVVVTVVIEAQRPLVVAADRGVVIQHDVSQMGVCGALQEESGLVYAADNRPFPIGPVARDMVVVVPVHAAHYVHLGAILHADRRILRTKVRAGSVLLREHTLLHDACDDSVRPKTLVLLLHRK